MGPENQEKPTLHIWDKATGERVPIPDTIVELTTISSVPSLRNQDRCFYCGAVRDYEDNYCGACGARMVWDQEEKEILKRKAGEYVRP